MLRVPEILGPLWMLPVVDAASCGCRQLWMPPVMDVAGLNSGPLVSNSGSLGDHF